MGSPQALWGISEMMIVLYEDTLLGGIELHYFYHTEDEE